MKISIIGGGITGLSTALALHKLGIKSKVYEQAPTLNEIGAGVWLQPNAVQVLQFLDIKEKVEKAGAKLHKMEITYPNLKPVKRIKEEIVADAYGNQTIAIHRGKLQAILYEECARLNLVSLGMKYLQHQREGVKTIINFEHSSVETDIVLAADGVKSTVRKTMGLSSEFRHTGQICYRGIAKFKLPKHLECEGMEVWAKHRRFGFSQISETEVYFFAVLNKSLCATHVNKEDLASFFTDFDPIIAELIKASDVLHIAELADLKRLATWHNYNTCLLGDAAHATTPNMGQGACQGIEDAFYISHFIKNHREPYEAFAEFEKHRRDKVDYVVNNSYSFGKMVHHNTGQFLLRNMMKLTPESILNKQMKKLYSLDAL